MTNQSVNPYYKAILPQLGRIISNLDRRPFSPTFGCFDREFWHYNTADFACARKQESCLTLALAYLANHKANPYYHNQQLLEWIKGSLHFWTSIQTKNGSFNEWYPLENSFVATAFSSYAVSETLILLKAYLQPKASVLSALEKAANFLKTQVQLGPQNQQTSLPILFYNLKILTNHASYHQRAKAQIRLISNLQTEEGWFNEYGGIDFGYLSVALDYIAKYHQKTGDKSALIILKKIVNFLAQVIDEGFLAAGSVGSRNTQYLIPYGIEYLASQNNKQAQQLAELIQTNLKNGVLVGPSQLDDRYLMYNGYTYLQAALTYRKTAHNFKEKIKAQPAFIHFSQSGLIKARNQKFTLTINCHKGGVFQLYIKDKKQLVTDEGIILRFSDKALTTAKQTAFQQPTIDRSNTSEIKITLSLPFFPLKNQNLAGFSFILLRVYQYILGRNERLSQWSKNVFRSLLILSRRPATPKLIRTIKFTPTSVSVTDQIENINDGKVCLYGPAQDIYVPSSRYFSTLDLNQPTLEVKNKAKFRRVWRTSD